MSEIRKFGIAIAGFLVGAAVIAGAVFALPQSTHATVKASMPIAQMTSATGMMRQAVTKNTPQTEKLTIQHVLRGCHVWSNGKTTGAMMRLRLKLGQQLMIVDQDIDAHHMVQFSGPMHMQMGGPMMMNQHMTLTFSKEGVYRMGTETVEMPGGMEAKTIGPDNKLRLVVTVA